MPPTRHRRRGSSRLSRAVLSRLSEDALLDVRLCDLPVALSDGSISRGIDRLKGELKARGLRFAPHFWLGDQWFCPDGVPGVAIAFYLAHPRLKRMERQHVGTLDGETFGGLMRLLRHETGHAIDHAYRLHRRRSWQRLFGRSSRRYPRRYRPDPFDRRYVVHLEGWYAQSHPDEDFAETFAVWLTPRSGWRRHYRGWLALQKLEYVDRLMKQIARRKQPVQTRIRPYPLSGDRRTLRMHYAARRAEGVYTGPAWYDDDLVRLFGARAGTGAADEFLHQHRAEMMRLVRPSCTMDAYHYRQVLDEFILRCRVLGLKSGRRQRGLLPELATLLTMHVHDPTQAKRRVIPV